MSLITQKKPNLAGGVNQQGAVHRHSTQVEEMINCIPTLNEGTRLRNPTAPIPVSDLDGVLSEVTFPDGNGSAFVYEHDRGIISGRQTEYAFIITANGGLEIIDLTLSESLDDLGQEILAGTIYKDGNGINYANQEARDYISSFLGRNSFAMTTVKDTTFVVNKTIAPKMTGSKQDLANPTLDYGDVKINRGSVGGRNPETVVSTGVTGEYNFTVPDDVDSMRYTIIGGGAGGGGGGGGEGQDSNGNNGAGGGGGAAGATISGVVDVTAGTVNLLHIGNGGGGGYRGDGGDNESSASAGLAGGAGGDSDILGLVGTGGSGGYGGAHESCGGNRCPCPQGLAGGNSSIGIGGLSRNCPDDCSQTGSDGLGGGLGAGASGGNGGTGSCGITDSGGNGGTGGVGGVGQMSLVWGTISVESTDYLRTGYVWIKSASVVTSGYAYGATISIRLKDDTLAIVIVPATSPNLDGTISGATLLAANITTELTNRGIVGAAQSEGSIVRITLAEPDAEGKYDQILSVEASDTFGDTASFGWAHKVETLADLPKSMGEYFPVVEVGSKKGSTYWLQYKEGIWKEHRSPSVYTQVDAFTMPHIIARKFNDVEQRFEFYIEQYEWDNRLVGDDDSNKLPSFLTDIDTIKNTYIKDIFFFRNRLGFITENSIITSEVGEYGNFWRTSTAALLDGDRIDANVESVNAVSMEYAILLEDSVMLFADKAQFRFSGGDILSPASYKIQQELAYDVDTGVRPLFMNDRIFFVADRGNHSAIYEMIISNSSNQDSQANDLTAHCQTYVDGNIERLTGSAVNNMLFLTSREGYTFTDGSYSRNTVFVYKYHEEGRQKQQSAWSKWTFDGDIISGFAISKNFYLMIDRNDAISEEDWILGTGQWLMNKPWKMDGSWIMSSESFEKFKQFERLAIQPKLEGGIFLDNRSTPIDGLVDLGEWVYGKDGNKDERGTLQMKTVEVTASDISTLKLTVTDTQRRTYREILDKQRRGRKPMVYGRSDRIRVGIRNEGDRGFRIEMVSFEGNINKRAKSH